MSDPFMFMFSTNNSYDPLAQNIDAICAKFANVYTFRTRNETSRRKRALFFSIPFSSLAVSFLALSVLPVHGLARLHAKRDKMFDREGSHRRRTVPTFFDSAACSASSVLGVMNAPYRPIAMKMFQDWNHDTVIGKHIAALRCKLK